MLSGFEVCQVAALRSYGLGLGSVHGLVYGFDYENDLVSLSSVAITATGRTSGRAVSMMNGAYQIYLPPGSYNVTASASGYISQTRMASVSSGSTSEIDFYLKPLV